MPNRNAEVLLNKEHSLKSGLKIAHEQFRDWYGALSIEELSTNGELVAKIKRLDRKFRELKNA